MRPTPTPARRTTRARTGFAWRPMLAAIGIGAALALATLVAVSCQSPRQTVFVDTVDRAADASDTVSVRPAEARTALDEPLIRVRIRKGVAEAALDRHGPWVVAQAGALRGEIVPGP
ncbi:MAG: hypothetical protein AAFN41_04350, partial [Planctomycetota bacterium]